METKRWISYLESVRGKDNDANTAAKLGVAQSTFTRWRAGTGHPKPGQVVQIARLYGANALSALIAAGYLEPDDLEELGTPVTPGDLESFSTDQLLAEVQSRLEAIGEYASWLEQLGGGRESQAAMSADALRYLNPHEAPDQVDGHLYIKALGDSLTSVDVLGVETFRPNVGGVTHNGIPHVGEVDVDELRRSGVALAADERDGVQEEQEKSQEHP